MNYHAHELLDRTNMVVDIIQAHLLDHSLMDDPEREDLQEILFKIESAQALLGSAYQAIGALPESFT